MAFAALTPELYCSNFDKTFHFYVNELGFDVLYQTPEEKFAYLERENAQIMIQELAPDSDWISEIPSYPFGRGVNFKILTTDAEKLYESLRRAGHQFIAPLKEQWYRKDQLYLGNRQFIIQDPDGYLLRFAQDLGSKTAQEIAKHNLVTA